MSATSKFPQLRKLYLRRALLTNWRALCGAIFGLLLIAIIVTHGLSGGGKVVAFFIAGIAYGVYSAFKASSLFAALLFFDKFWTNAVNEHTDDQELRALLPIIEQELSSRVRRFRDVVFTENYLISFVDFGAFALTKGIKAVYYDWEMTETRSMRMPIRSKHELWCTTNELGRVTLTYQYHEIARILSEVLYHNPNVYLDYEARTEFYVVDHAE